MRQTPLSDERIAEASDPRLYFAAERTLLAWIRTGLALMGFGFIVARFGLTLLELAELHQEKASSQTNYSLWVGVALVIVGVVITAAAACRHFLWVKRSRVGIITLPGPVSLVTLLAATLAGIGVVIALVLLLGIRH